MDKISKKCRIFPKKILISTSTSSMNFDFTRWKKVQAKGRAFKKVALGFFHHSLKYSNWIISRVNYHFFSAGKCALKISWCQFWIFRILLSKKRVVSRENWLVWLSFTIWKKRSWLTSYLTFVSCRESFFSRQKVWIVFNLDHLIHHWVKYWNH